jgi:uncharacterized protein (DUF1330 family)
MSYYVYVDVEVTDLEGLMRYGAAVAPLVEAAGGRYLARGGATRGIEGTFAPAGSGLLEFPSKAAWDAFYDSAAYQPLKGLRQRSTHSTLVGFEGL